MKWSRQFLGMLLELALFVGFCGPLASAQTPFTRTYQLGGGIEVACCAKGPMSWGFTPVIQDTSLSGNVQVTSVTVSDAGNILATDPNGVAGTTWEIFIGPSPCGFPVGELQGSVSLTTYSCSASTASTQLIFNTNTVFSGPLPQTSVYAASVNLVTNVFTANDIGQFVLGTTTPSTVTQGLYVQVLLWGGDVGADLQLSNISVTVTGTAGSVQQQPLLGASGTPTNPTGSFAEPVDTATGNYYSSSTDMAFSGRGLGLSFSRSYNSLDSYSGPLGPGWTHTYNLFLAQDLTSGNVSLKREDGSTVLFSPDGSGGYQAATPGLYDKLDKHADGSFALTRTNQLTLGFSSAGKLVSVVDHNGNMQLLSYDASGDLVTISDTVGRVFTFTYGANHLLLTLTDPFGRTVSYNYDSTGHLASATNAAGGVTKYFYNAGSQLTSAVDARGVTYVTNSYDDQGRVSTQTNGRGAIVSFAYNTPSSGVTTITDGNGNTIKHLYDAGLRLIATMDALGDTVAFSYDANNDRTSVTNAVGNVTTFTYDTNGNVVSVNNAAGNKASFVYDDHNNLLSATDPLGNTTTLSYDPNGNLTKVKDALSDTTDFSYDGYGEMTKITDAVSNVITLAWNGSGSLTQATDGAGRTQTFTYDAFGRLTGLTNALGRTWTNQYDILNRVVSKSNPLGNKKQFSYDAVGNITQVVDGNGHPTSYQYDGAGNLTAMIDALGNKTAYTFDGSNNRVSMTNANGGVTSYIHDPANRRIVTIDPLGRSFTFSYDPNGNLLTDTDANMNTSRFAYDALNHPIRISYADGSSVAFTYDANGNRTSMEDALGITSYDYDALSRLIGITRFDSKTVKYAFNAVGMRTSMEYPDGRVVQYRYDGSNKLQAVIDWLGKTTAYSYDEAGNLTSISSPNSTFSSYGYDAANRLVGVQNSSRVGPLSDLRYQLDSVGNRLAVVESRSGASLYTYDALNRLISWTGKGTLGPIKYSYDAVGNRTAASSRIGSIAYTYDAADELVKAGPASFTYDSDGNRISETLSGFTATYGWNSARKLVSFSSPLGIDHYSYDGDGDRVSQSTEFGQVGYVNDILRRLPVVVSQSSATSTSDNVYGYSLVSSHEGNDIDYVSTDGLGSVVNVTGSSGFPEQSWSYDPWGIAQISGHPDPDQMPYRFAGQAFDSADGLYYMRGRYYDPLVGEFISRDPIGTRVGSPFDQNRYTYARNNPVRYADPSGFSAEDSVTSPGPLTESRAFDATHCPTIVCGIGISVGGTLFGGDSGLFSGPGQGSAVTGSTGGGIYWGAGSGVTTGMNSTSGGYSGAGHTLGGAAGVGGGVYLTNATSNSQLSGPFSTTVIELGPIEVQWSTDSNETKVLTVTGGAGGGFGVSEFTTDTDTTSLLDRFSDALSGWNDPTTFIDPFSDNAPFVPTDPDAGDDDDDGGD